MFLYHVQGIAVFDTFRSFLFPTLLETCGLLNNVERAVYILVSTVLQLHNTVTFLGVMFFFSFVYRCHSVCMLVLLRISIIPRCIQYAYSMHLCSD